MTNHNATQTNSRAGSPDQRGTVHSTEAQPNPRPCFNPPQPEPVIRHELYFGLRRRDGSIVPESIWDEFALPNLPRCFPRGYTVFDGAGYWKGDEPSKVVVAYIPAGQPFVGTTVAALALCWKLMAKQDCVLAVRSHAVAYEL